MEVIVLIILTYLIIEGIKIKVKIGNIIDFEYEIYPLKKFWEGNDDE